MSRQTDNAALPSPCISVCQLDPVSGHCIGCFRTGTEIAAWRSMTLDDQRELLDALRDRRAAAIGVVRRPTRRRRG
ncbi:MAG: DUF1289 domain-containing protein [SAR116 cluster bacterium]|nr:MAG: DUF1289 domain-containing protein [SAR116 cluster bacterium]